MPPETRPEIPAIENIRHVHLVAVCGTAMGSLACMLADRGFRVTGSDEGIGVTKYEAAIRTYRQLVIDFTVRPTRNAS